MNKIILFLVSLFIGTNAAVAQMQPRQHPVAPDSQYVPVNLNQLANDKSTFDAPSSKINFDKVPFNIADNAGNNNLFLKNAGWPDWEKDPYRFTSTYDTKPKEPTDTMPVVQIPVDDYSAVYVLAACENDPAYSNILSLRIGIKGRGIQVTYHDYEFTVPRQNQKTGKYVQKVLSSPSGNIFLLRLPINGAFAQDFSTHRTLDVEITKKLRVSVSKPDAARYQKVPLGLPSGVHIYGMTFERAPLRLFMKGTQTGNVFNEPQTPSFWLRLDPFQILRDVEVHAEATDYYGNVITFPSWKVSERTSRFPVDYKHTLQLPVPRRGYYVLKVSVTSRGKVLSQRETTFALLPKNIRQHRAQSPFGTYDFRGGHYTPYNPDILGPLYVKAGLRYSMFNFSEEDSKKYGLIHASGGSVRLRDYMKDGDLDLEAGLAKLDAQIANYKKEGYVPPRWLIYHEDSISGNHVTRTPDLFTGKQYEFNDAEQKKFDIMWKVAEASTRRIRAAFPTTTIYLGNGMPHLMEEFLRHKFPKELFDVLGNEAAAFQRYPESQPLDFVANNASMWMERHLLDSYGYEDKWVEQCGEIDYPSSNPGNMTLRGQANYVVRNAMHSLAWKVPAISLGEIVEPGNSYFYSNWGGAGMMFSKPNLSPKPLYVAVATMTQMLDGATFTRMLPSVSNVVYAFEFKRQDGKFITCIWTPKTDYRIAIVPPGVSGGTLYSPRKVTVTDLMGNTKILTAPNYNTNPELTASQAPVFVESDGPIWLATRHPIETGLPDEKYFSINALNDATQWQLNNGDNDELDAYNFMQPRVAGEFYVTNKSKVDGEKDVLEIHAKFLDVIWHGNVGKTNNSIKNWWIPRYTQLKLKTPKQIDGKPTHIGLMVYGNAGWGRIIFELEDAAGQRWISLGTEAKGAPNPWLADWLSKEEFAKLQNSANQSAGVSDWNSNDVWGDSYINFAGWHYMNIPLPGNYPGEGYHWPRTSQWRCVKADGSRGDYTVHYPLKFKALNITARSKVLYGTEVKDVYRPEIYLKDLVATYGDPDTAFWKPDMGQR